MSLPVLALRYRTIVVVIVVLLVVWGVFSFYTMPRREDPEFTIRTCVVTTQWSGTPAIKVEELVTDPLEEELDGIEEVDVVRSTSTTGLSTIYVDLEDAISPSAIANVWDKVRARVAKVKMPDPDIKPIVNDEFGDTSIILFAVYQRPLPGQSKIDDDYRYSDRQLDIFSDKIRDALRLLPGVAKVERHGVREEAIYIETDTGTWSQLNLTTDKLQQLVASRNIVVSGGTIDTDDGRFSVKPGGELNAVDEIKSIVVALADSDETANQVYLKDLGLKVKRDYVDPPPLLCRYGDVHTSATAVIVSLTMKSGANIIDICTAAKNRVRELQTVDKVLPPDIAVTPISDQSENVSARIQDVIVNVIQAIVIVIVVVFLVVGFRTAAVMAANIPFVVLASLAIVTLFGVQLEQISLASMIIALGLLVDNAVQVCDQARTNQMNGMSPADAAVAGANTLALPMLNGTLTTIAAFFPMLIALEGGGKEFIYSLPVTLSTMLAVSWLLAMTFCVLLAALFIRAPKDPSRPSAPLPYLMAFVSQQWSRYRKTPPAAPSEENVVTRTYGGLVAGAIRGKFVVLGVSLAIFYGATLLPVGSEFFPQNERDQFVVELYLPENSTIEQTDAAAQKVEKILRALSPTKNESGEKVERLLAMRTIVGGGGSRWYLSWNPEPRKPNYAEILVRTANGRYTHELATRVREIAERGDAKLGLQPLAGVRVVPTELMLGPPADPVVIRVMGNGFADPSVLRDVSEKVKTLVRNQKGTWDVHDSWGVKGFQVRVDVDPDKANLAGVTNLQVAQTLNAYFSGQYLTTFREGDHQVPVYFRLNPEQRRSLSALPTAFVEGNNGRVPLNSIANVVRRWETTLIERRDLNRVIEVRSQVESGVSGNDVVKRIMASEEMKQIQAELPSGFHIEVGGALEESMDSMEQMLYSFGLSFVIIVLLLVIQYNSVAKALIILTTLPLALIGALFGLWLTNNPLGFMPQLGVLSLFGIVLNTGIIFIEFADILIRQRAEQSDGQGPIAGLTRAEFRQCLADAGKQRLLPIFLTTATTIGGLLPLALGGGPLWTGMAWGMIFGLLVATLLTLFVVPALYAIVVETFGIQPVRLAKDHKDPTAQPATDTN